MGVRFRIYIIRFKVSKLTHFPIYVKEKARLCGRGGKYTSEMLWGHQALQFK